MRLEKEIEEMEAARLRMKEERRLAQAKAEEEEKLRSIMNLSCLNRLFLRLI